MKMKKRILTLAVMMIMLTAVSASAQYASRIRPVIALPATCNPLNGDVVSLTTGGVTTLYHCTAANTWSVAGQNTNSTFVLPAAGILSFSTRSNIRSSADGLLTLLNTAATDFVRLNLGPIAVTHPAIAVSPAVAGQTQGIIILRADGTAQVQASLGAATNGSIIYCADCTIANPCVGGGTGAIAKRLNGVWVCN
jgi:hypothetical protein